MLVGLNLARPDNTSNEKNDYYRAPLNTV